MQIHPAIDPQLTEQAVVLLLVLYTPTPAFLFPR